MLVKIEEIQGAGLERTEAIAAPVLEAALADSDGFRLVKATPLQARFKKVSGRVFVTGSFSADVSCPCKRCAKPVAVHVDMPFSLRMVPELPKREPDEALDKKDPSKRVRAQKSSRQKKEDDDAAERAASFELDEIDAEPFDGKTIDLDPIVREQLLLALPVTVLCREDCKGLCSVCGHDLNEQDCGHGKTKEIDVRLQKLRDIKLKN